uniref:Uncharacterized protein n=1 Tax=Knipowitschia caucasica TaxID=637954 RepID=A0AAV2LIH2_KNICA
MVALSRGSCASQAAAGEPIGPGPAAACPGGCLSWGLPVPGAACPGGCLSRGLPVPGAACPGGCLSRGLPVPGPDGETFTERQR